MLTPKYFNVNDAFIQGECTRNISTFNGPVDTVVDIGAHIGFFTFAAIEAGAKQVWCFEPTPDNFNKLVNNVCDAGLLGRVMPIPLAVGGYDALFQIGHVGHNSGQHGLMMKEKHNSPYVARMISPERLLALLPDNIDYMKIDIEGAEYSFFNSPSSWELLKRVRYLEMELHDPMLCADIDRGKLPDAYREDSLSKLVDAIQAFGFSEGGASAKSERHIKSSNLRGELK